MQGNAQEVLAFLEARGWSLNAIAGLCGNMQSESNINPGIWQSLQEGNYAGGFGLVQWTPATNYTNWAGANGYGITDPNGQLTWIDSVTVPAGQWIPTGAYPLSFDQFKVSGESPEYLASAFLKNFERAGVEVEQARRRRLATGMIICRSILADQKKSMQQLIGHCRLQMIIATDTIREVDGGLTMTVLRY